jgi:ACS family sodium-dependent inorganic phosphate cotransporter
MAKTLYLSGYVSDKLIERKLSYTFVRKMFCVSGFIAQSLFMFSMTFITDPAALIVLLTLAIGFGGLPWSSFGVNHLDIGARV